jgi:hypothetical protein
MSIHLFLAREAGAEENLTLLNGSEDFISIFKKTLLLPKVYDF